MQLDLGLGMPETTARRGASPAPVDVLAWLEAWHESGWLRLLDLQFARFLYDEKPDVSGLCLLAAALASHQLGRGHVCLDLAAALNTPEETLNLPPDDTLIIGAADEAPPMMPADVLKQVSLADWEASFHADIVSDGHSPKPLVYAGGKLYLYRYWRYEQLVAKGVEARLKAAEGQPPCPPENVRGLLDVLFGPATSGPKPDWQRMACALAARQHFAIITGGPGTGKTTTVVRLLVMLQALHMQSPIPGEPGRQPLRIRLAAPTGKAAARLTESIVGKIGELPWERLGGVALAQSIPTQVVTLHSLLGSRPNVRKRTYHADNPLPLDVLVVDEASMVSLSDMADLITALPSTARLVLIGDKDQLSSVEAGSVLGELCQRAAGGHYLPEVATWLSKATGQDLPVDKQDIRGRKLDQAVAMLRFSHRFDGNSGIGRLALSVNEGAADAVVSLLQHPPADLASLRLDAPEGEVWTRLIVDGTGSAADRNSGKEGKRQGYSHYLERVAAEPDSDDPDVFDAWAADVLRAHRRAQVLCVLRNGPWGVAGLNLSIARVLYGRGLIAATAGWYAGRPVMVTRNNKALKLTNGDIGVVLPYPSGVGAARSLRVAFHDEKEGSVRWFAPNRLDDVETVYALTVHKSQGSEFNHALLVLPPKQTPVLTRELLYTGITRASHWFTLVNPGGEKLLRNAVEQRVYRSSGLGDLLTGIG